MTCSAVISTMSSDVDLTHLWHAHLGHKSENGMAILRKRGVLGGEGTDKLNFCNHCVFGKQKQVNFSTLKHRINGTLDYIHFGLWGLSRVPSFGGKSYMLTFVDNLSRKVWIYFLRHKNKIFPMFKKFKALVDNQTLRKIKKCRTDTGFEFFELDFNEFCVVHGIARYKTLIRKSQQNRSQNISTGLF